MRRIGGIFGKSPFGPSHEHILKVLECLDTMTPLVEAATAGDRATMEENAAVIRRLEQEADELKNAIRAQFTTSIFASVSRSELMALTKAQDDVADECDRVAYELSVRHTRFPAFLADGASAMVRKIVSSGAPLKDVSRTLDESGGHLDAESSQKVHDLLENTRRVLEDVEPLYDKFLRSLFGSESQVEPLDVIFIMRFAEHADRIAKKVENVVDVLTRLITGRG